MIDTGPPGTDTVISRTVAVAEPLGPVAVMETVESSGMAAGAVNSPVELIVPALAVQLVAPAAVNCWVWPRLTDTESGEMVNAACAVRVTFAVAEPLGPVAVTVTAGEAGIVAGAVNNPVELIVPALAVQLVVASEPNCSVWPSTTVAAVGVME